MRYKRKHRVNNSKAVGTFAREGRQQSIAVFSKQMGLVGLVNLGLLVLLET
jgi:hypothetical protein